MMHSNDRFSVALMNPPYDKNLHLKFLARASEMSENVVSVQPLAWLQNIYATENKNSNFNKYKNIGITDVEYVGRLEDIFNNVGIRTSTNIAIFTINKNKSACDLNKELYKYTEIYSGQRIDDGLVYRFSKKLIDYCKSHTSIEDVIKTGEIDNNTKYCIIMLRMMGGPEGKLTKFFYTKSKIATIYYKGISQKNGKTASDNKIKQKHITNYTIFDYLEFNTETECKNWIKSQDTDFYRFAILLSCTGATRNGKFVPYMNDYTREWTDEDFYNYFDISLEDQKLIRHYIQLYDNEWQRERSK